MCVCAFKCQFGPGLSSKPFVMLQILLVSPASSNQFFTKHLETLNFDQWMWKQPYSVRISTCIIQHREAQTGGTRRITQFKHILRLSCWSKYIEPFFAETATITEEKQHLSVFFGLFPLHRLPKGSGDTSRASFPSRRARNWPRNLYRKSTTNRGALWTGEREMKKLTHKTFNKNKQQQ